MPRGVHASVVRKPEARLYSGSTCLAGSCDLPTRQSGDFFDFDDHRRRSANTRSSSDCARAGAPPAWVTVGIGDDAAVVEPERGELDVVTTDSLVEGVHFRRDWTAPASIGHKALAVNLSDLAAMGATPRASLLAWCCRRTLRSRTSTRSSTAFVALASGAGAPLVGGNLARSPGPLVVDVTAIGVRAAAGACFDAAAARAGRRALRHRRARRRGGRPRDADGRRRSSRRSPADARACVERYERPDARLRCGLARRAGRAAPAVMDLSDGLADAARQMAAASGTGVVIDAESLPVHAGARVVGGADRRRPGRRRPSPAARTTSCSSPCAPASGGRSWPRRGRLPRSADDAVSASLDRRILAPGSTRDGPTVEPLPAGFTHFVTPSVIPLESIT